MKQTFTLILILISNGLFSQSNDTYQIYSVVLKGNYGKAKAKRIAVESITSTFDILKDSDFVYFKEKFIGLKKETFDKFKLSNLKPDTIRNDFKQKNHVIIVNKEQINEIFKEESGWDIFYSKFGNTQGILTLSKVGFSEDNSQALVYFGIQSDFLAGAGYYGFFTKKGNNWILKSKFIVWIS